MKTRINSLLTVLALFLFIELQIQPSVGISLKKFLSLSKNQKRKFDEFKQLVKPRLPHEYMKRDVYLIRFLRENDFDVRASEEMLINMLRWREENKMDTILEEDFSEFEDEYRGYVEGCDKEGRPIISANTGEWDIRRIVLTGKEEKFKRYYDRTYEQIEILLRAMQEDGQNVTQVWSIVDVSNFNLVTHACSRCVPIYLYVLVSFQRNFPGYVHKLVAVNSPSLATPLWELIKPTVSPKLKEVLEIFGTDKAKWQKYLLQEIEPSQLSKQFGGTRQESLNGLDLVKSKKVFRCELPFSEYTSHNSSKK